MVKIIKILFIASLFGFLIFFLFHKNVNAGADDNVTGFAWSDKTSWISFNCLNDWDNDGLDENQCGRQNSSNLVLDLRLDEGLGLITRDNTGNNNDGHFGMDSDPEETIYASYFPKWKRGNDCKFRSCLEFDGSDAVRIHDNVSLDITTNITIEAWVKFSNIETKQSIIGKKEDWAGYGLRLNEEYVVGVTQPNHKLYFVLEGGSPDRYIVASDTTVVVNQWYHVVGVRDGTDMKIYVNGELPNTLSGTTLAANNYDLFLGADPAGAVPGSLAEMDYPLEGSIDEVKIYSRALSDLEINTSGYYDYGVSIDTETGIFDGYAWSENLGYITFNKAELDDCPIPPCEVGQVGQVETDFSIKPREIFGWARACAVFQSGCSGNLSPNRGGWDGWIRFRGDGAPPIYKTWADTTVIPTQLKGWAWADDRSVPILGWISFNCSNTGSCASSNYKVTTPYKFNRSPYVEPGSGTTNITNCGIFSGQSQVSLSWVFRDPDLDNESSFDFKVNDVDDIDDSNPEVSRSRGEISDIHDGDTNRQFVLVGSELEFNKPVYYWWARVYDDMGNVAKDWFAGPTFTTPVHAYPWPNFTHSPKSPSNKEVVNFTDESDCYNAGSSIPYLCKTNLLNNYVWDFGDNTSCSGPACRGNVQHTYTIVNNYTVTLTITDNVGACSGTGDSPIVVTYPLPEWKEIPPTSSIFKFFSRIGDFLKTGLF